jgi:hypothetical protein
VITSRCIAAALSICCRVVISDAPNAAVDAAPILKLEGIHRIVKIQYQQSPPVAVLALASAPISPGDVLKPHANVVKQVLIVSRIV